jgi:hypothetical protein
VVAFERTERSFDDVDSVISAGGGGMIQIRGDRNSLKDEGTNSPPSVFLYGIE